MNKRVNILLFLMLKFALFVQKPPFLKKKSWEEEEIKPKLFGFQ